MIYSQLQPNENCFEYRMNFYHLMGIQNCFFCNNIAEIEELDPYSDVKVIEKIEQKQLKKQPFNQQPLQQTQQTHETQEEWKTNYQREILEKQEDEELPEISQEEQDYIISLREKYEHCECCRGFVMSCNGQICKTLGKCYCVEKDVQEHLAYLAQRNANQQEVEKKQV